jgi:hypothetical protein
VGDGHEAARVHALGQRVGGPPDGSASAAEKMPLSKDDQELRRLGWSEGGNVQFDESWSTDNMDVVRADAARLVELNPDVILTTGDRVIPVFKKLTGSIPTREGKDDGRYSYRDRNHILSNDCVCRMAHCPRLPLVGASLTKSGKRHRPQRFFGSCVLITSL